MPLTTEERTRLGRELRRLRNDQRLNQKAIATRSGMSVGTVQHIERATARAAKHNATDENIDAYARAVGTTLELLLNPEARLRVDPKWRGLNDEHLTVARQYAMALMIKRTAVEVLLVDDVAGTGRSTELAEMVLALHEDPIRLQVCTDVVECLAADPTFDPALRELIERTKAKQP